MSCIDQVNEFNDILQLVIVELVYKVREGSREGGRDRGKEMDGWRERGREGGRGKEGLGEEGIEGGREGGSWMEGERLRIKGRETGK